MTAASILPFASGTGPAAKGTILEMVPPSLEADALSAIALVETVATVMTVALFGMAFAWFTQEGRPEGVFALNAVSSQSTFFGDRVNTLADGVCFCLKKATALLAAVILGFVRFANTKTDEENYSP